MHDILTPLDRLPLPQTVSDLSLPARSINRKTLGRPATEKKCPCSCRLDCTAPVTPSDCAHHRRHRAIRMPDRRFDSLRIERVRTDCDAF